MSNRKINYDDPKDVFRHANLVLKKINNEENRWDKSKDKYIRRNIDNLHIHDWSKLEQEFILEVNFYLGFQPNSAFGSEDLSSSLPDGIYQGPGDYYELSNDTSKPIGYRHQHFWGKFGLYIEDHVLTNLRIWNSRVNQSSECRTQILKEIIHDRLIKDWMAYKIRTIKNIQHYQKKDVRSDSILEYILNSWLHHFLNGESLKDSLRSHVKLLIYDGDLNKYMYNNNLLSNESGINAAIQYFTKLEYFREQQLLKLTKYVTEDDLYLVFKRITNDNRKVEYIKQNDIGDYYKILSEQVIPMFNVSLMIDFLFLRIIKKGYDDVGGFLREQINENFKG